MTPEEIKAAIQQLQDQLDRQNADNAALNKSLADEQAARQAAEAEAARLAAESKAKDEAHAAELAQLAAAEEPEPEPVPPPAPVLPPRPPVAPAAPEKPAAPLGRNGRPVISRTYALPLLLAFALILPIAGCAGTAAGNALDNAAGLKVTVNPDGTKTYEKLPSSPIQDLGGLFGPIGVAVSGLVAGGIYGIRLLGNSVPVTAHNKALDNAADPVSTVTTTHTGPTAS